MDAQAVTQAALEVLAESGFEKLNMRAVAARLGVHVGGLYYHVPDKTGLLRLMADRLCAQVSDELHPVGDWHADALDLCRATRRVLLSRRDAARVLAQSPLAASTGALDLMERLLRLLSHGIATDRLNVAGDTLLSYVTGYVLQEQIGADASGFDAALLAEAPARYPLVFTDRDDDSDTAFTMALEAILTGFAAG